MNILIITTTTDLPEANLIAELSSRHHHKILLLGNPKADHANILLSGGVKIQELALPSRFSLSAISAIKRAATKHEANLVHYFSNRAISNGLIALRGTNIRHVAYRGAMGNVSRIDPLSWMTYLNPKLDKIICVSKAVHHYLSSAGIDERKLSTIYKGHILSWYDRPDNHLSDDVSRIFVKHPDKIVIGCTANMRPVKGIDVLLNAVKLIPQEIPLHVALIGEMRDKKLVNLIKEVGKHHLITPLGFQHDPIPYLKLFDLFVMPSRDREGLPKAVIEAMIQRVVPIVTSIGGMPELVEDGVCGLVVEPDNPQKLAQAITKLATQPLLRSQWGEVCRNRINEHFNFEATLSKTDKLYRELLS